VRKEEVDVDDATGRRSGPLGRDADDETKRRGRSVPFKARMVDNRGGFWLIEPFSVFEKRANGEDSCM
jgi:hypothetical protein